MSARELLRALHDAYSCNYYSDDGVEEPRYIGTRIIRGGEVVSVYGTYSEIRAALRSKPHVPSKPEAKMIRRLQAQTGMTEQQLRAHPRYGQMIADPQGKRRVLDRRNTDQIRSYQRAYGSSFGRFFVVA
jgi:hypothetical protein